MHIADLVYKDLTFRNNVLSFLPTISAMDKFNLYLCSRHEVMIRFHVCLFVCLVSLD